MGITALLLAAAVVGQSVSAPCSCTHCGGEQPPLKPRAVAVGDSFVVRSGSPQVDASDLLKHAQAARQALCSQWLGDEAAKTAWSPPCEVVLHRDRASYLRAVGPTGRTTTGSTLVRFNEGRVAVRRIDLLAGVAGKHYDTLSHELVHAIFAERFPQATPPRWAEEGAALLADSAAKRRAHREEFAQLHRARRTFAVRELLGMNDYPAPQRFPEFYGQSLVLVEFLTVLGDSTDFVRFVDRSLATDPDQALHEVYGLASAAQLESLWTEHAGKVSADALAKLR